MKLTTLAICLSLPTAVLANVEFLEPAFGSTHNGGHVLTAYWRESGVPPRIVELESYQLYLCAGGTDEDTIEVLAVLIDHGVFERGNFVSFQVPTHVGGNEENAYFLKMVARGADTVVVNFSDRFTLSGMTGTFSPAVQRGIQSFAAQSDNDPNRHRRLTRRQQKQNAFPAGGAGGNAWANGDVAGQGGGAAGANAWANGGGTGAGAAANAWANGNGAWQGAAGADAVAGANQWGNGGGGGAWQGVGGAGSNPWANGGAWQGAAGAGAGAGAGAHRTKDPHTVPYSEQTGATRYAPMPKHPDTTITAKTRKRQFPTSPYRIATTLLPPATVLETVYATQTFTTTSIENSASPAPHPNARRDKKD